MAEKRVKIGKGFEHIPAVKSGRGWLNLEKGKFGKVRFESRSQKLELWIKQGNEWKRSLLPVEEYAKANEAARKANKVGEQAGASFGTLRKEEEAALKRWREYVLERQKAGSPARNLDDILREAIEREETKDETPLFKDAVFQFLEMKDKQGTCSVDYRNRIRSRLSAFSKAFKGKRLSEISEPLLLETVNRIARAKDGSLPAAKTRKHWIEIAKELFKWFYRRENATRRAADKLNNPLEIVEAPKVFSESEPEILTVEQARAFLYELWETAPESVPAVVLQMFCGVREFEALRLRWGDIVDGELRLSRKITKTQQARAVPISPNAFAWIDACRVRGLATPQDGFIFPVNELSPEMLNAVAPEARERIVAENTSRRASAYCRRLRKVFERLTFPKPKNGLRHTAVSCLAAIHGQVRAADWCGHSRQIQGQHYRNPVSQIQAQDYFGIMPPVGDGKAIAFDRSRNKNGANSASKAQGDKTESPADLGATA